MRDLARKAEDGAAVSSSLDLPVETVIEVKPGEWWLLRIIPIIFRLMRTKCQTARE